MIQPFKAHYRPLKLAIRKFLAGQMSLMEIAYVKSVYFSQFGEDVFLQNHFHGRKTGFYVDVGAFHPFNLSNTCFFYKKGWSGINIEPNPVSFRAFPKHRPRDINLNVAVSREDTEVLFNCCGEMSGIDGGTHLFRERQGIKQCRIRARPLAAILREHLPDGTRIDFMSVDCEGHDLEVLQSNDWVKFRPRVILVEDHVKKPGEIDVILGGAGYEFHRKLGLTKVFVEASGMPTSMPPAPVPSVR